MNARAVNIAAARPQIVPKMLVHDPVLIKLKDGCDTRTTPSSVRRIMLTSNQEQSSFRQMQAKSETKTGDVKMQVAASASGIKWIEAKLMMSETEPRTALARRSARDPAGPKKQFPVERTIGEMKRA